MASGSLQRNGRPAVLLMSRGPRLHRYFREMATELSRDHQVVVIATAEEIPSFSAVPGVDVYEHESLDIVFNPKVARQRVRDLNRAQVLSRVSWIEHELGIPLYKAATNYLLYAEFVRSQYGMWQYLTTEIEILAAFDGAYRQLSQLFERYRPRAVYYETVDLISTYVALALTKKYGSFAFEFKFAPLTDGHMNLVYGLDRQNLILDFLYAHPETIAPCSFAKADEFISRYQQRADASSYAAIHRRMIRGNSLLNPKRLLNAVGQVERIPEYVRAAKRHAAFARNRAWLRRHLSKDVPREPYLAYFLQHQPEATTFSHVPRWSRQDAIVEQLALNAPAGLKILVKEHPRTYGSRGAEFFGRLKRLPNVLLCHPEVDNNIVLANATGILALTGASGFEGILLGKKVVVLGRPFYANYRGVRVLTFPDEAFDADKQADWDEEEMTNERRTYVAAYLQSCFPFGHGEGTEMWPPTGGDKWASALRQTLQFIDRHGIASAQLEFGV